LVYRLAIDPEQIQGETIKLNPEQFHYLKRVLRLKLGDRFVVMDGQGQAWMAQLAETTAQILNPLAEFRELPLAITLMVALPKGNGFDDIVRSGTELGVTTFMPIISERTLLNPSAHKLDRWRKIATEAAEQSERQIIPSITEPVNFISVLTKVENLARERYICVTRKKASHLLTQLQNDSPQNLMIATGPEGGWTTQEIDMAIAMGFKPVSLGSRILRAVTAPLVAVSLVAGTVEAAIIDPS
jgi:16S rRNA (uracil1498-N3)-methyltransferase